MAAMASSSMRNCSRCGCGAIRPSEVESGPLHAQLGSLPVRRNEPINATKATPTSPCPSWKSSSLPLLPPPANCVCVCVCAACICLNFNELSSRKLQSYEEAAFHLPLDDLRLELQILMAAVANSNLEAALAICSLSQSILAAAAASIATAPGTGTASRAAIRACRKLLFRLPLQLPQFALLSLSGGARPVGTSA